MQAARELTELLERLGELLPRAPEDLDRSVDVGLEPGLREPQGEGKRREPLLGAVVEVALQPASRRVGGVDDPRPGGAELLLLSLALADVGARDQHPGDARLVEDRRRRPRHGQLPSVPGDPSRLALGLLDAVRGAGDRHPRGELVVACDDLEERPAAELFEAAPGRIAERLVRAVRDDRRVVVRDDDEARDRVRDGVREVALPLQVDLPPLPLGDVDAARDDPDDLHAGVDERRGAPRDHALLAAGVREHVLVLGRDEVGRGGVEARDHLLALAGIDEDVPEVGALDAAPVVVETARDLDRTVEVPDASLGVDDGQEARSRVDDRLEETVLGTELGLESLLLEGERRRGGDRVDEVALVGQRAVVEEGRDALPPVLHERRRDSGGGERLAQRVSVGVDPRLPFRRPVGDLQGRVAERDCQRVAKGRSLAESDREVRDSRARQVEPEEAREERDGHQRERDEGEMLEPDGGVLAEGTEEAARDQRGKRLEGEEVHRAHDPAERRRRCAVAAHEPDEDDERDRTRRQRVDHGRHACRPGKVGDEQRVLRAIAAPGDRRLVDEQHRERAEGDDRRDGPDDPAVARGKSPGGIREDEQRERDEGQPAQQVAEGEGDRPVGGLQGAEGPEQPDGEHLRARSVVHPAGGRDRARDREDEPRGDDEHDERPPVAEVVREDEREGRRVQDGAQRDGGREPAAGHLSSKRTAEPESSAFAMKPRARLLRMRPS